jgi:hypothetical protein
LHALAKSGVATLDLSDRVLSSSHRPTLPLAHLEIQSPPEQAEELDQVEETITVQIALEHILRQQPFLQLTGWV